MKVIGLRTIKTGIAVTLAVIISDLLHFTYPFFIAMTAIISMDKTVLNSFKMARNRLCGTLVGACVGLLMAYISRGNPFLCGLGVMIMIVILKTLHLEGGIGVGGIVLMAIMVHTQDNILDYAIYRTVDTFIGGCIAFIVNLVVAPYENDKNLIKTVDKAIIESTHLFEKLNKNEEIEIEQIKKEMFNIETEIKLYENEIVFKKQSELIALAKNHLDILEQMMTHLTCIPLVDKKDDDIIQYHRQQAIKIYANYLETI